MGIPGKALTTALVLAFLAAGGQARARAPYTLDEVLGAMDAASRRFVDMQSDIRRETVTVFINHTRTETGRMYFVRDGGESRIRVSIVEPASREFLIDDGEVRIYNPGTGTLEEIELGEHEDKVEFMVIGFGTSRADLLRFYDVSLAGEDTVDGIAVSVLDLVPKDPDVARHFTRIRLWMDQETWIPVQTRATQLSGDYLTVRFLEVLINSNFEGRTFDLELPADVQVIRH
jgi:outer membrane lipoprotein-sorting protein